MLTDAVRATIEASHAELRDIRRDIHAHPEMGMEEVRTSALVAAKLRAWGIADVVEGVGKTGVVATIHGRLPGQRAIGLRADMDALSIHEQTGLPYASTHPGVMHACGHDGHTAMLLGAARALHAHPDFAGTVRLIFQPAEEGRGGARAMLDDGLFARFPVDAVYGMHNFPGMQVGTFGLRKGPMMASGGRWTATFRGTGGHGGATPHLATDATVAAAQFIQALQTIVSRSVAPSETAVVSVGAIAGGSFESTNVMPAEVRIGGTMRCFSQANQALISARMEAIGQAAALATGCTAEVALRWIMHVLVNHDEQADVAAAAAASLVGADHVDTDQTPTTGGEDFAFMLEERPGSFIFLGNGIRAQGPTPGLHTPLFDFNDEIIPLGVSYWVSLVGQELALQGG